jgi:ATP-dependent protease ClpP protease subunit
MYLFGGIDKNSAELVVRAMNDDPFTTLWLCSHGGDLHAAFAIYDAIVGRGITVIGTGHIASAGVLVYLAGDKRYHTSNTTFTTHPIGWEGVEEMDEQDQKELMRLRGMYSRAIAKRADMELEDAVRLLSSTYNFGADEAEELGISQGEWKAA